MFSHVCYVRVLCSYADLMEIVDLPKLLLLLAVDADQVGVIHSTGDLRRALDVLVLEKLETFGVLQ